MRRRGSKGTEGYGAEPDAEAEPGPEAGLGQRRGQQGSGQGGLDAEGGP